jgi:hypothetical protein
MRSDMSKVIVERPRLRSRANNDDKGELKLWQRAQESPDYELAPRRGSSSRRRRRDWKELNEFLAPLRRFLDSHVGKHWDKIYSEIRSQVNPNNTVQMHIIQHLIGRFGYVETNVKAWPDGTFTTSEGKELRSEWFVNPKSGCLARNLDSHLHGGDARYRSERALFREPKYVKVGGRQFRELDGIWYEFELRPVSAPAEFAHLRLHARRWYLPDNLRPEPLVYDVYLRAWPSFLELEDAHGPGEGAKFIYAASKRQLNKKEIKLYKLRPANVLIPASQTRR